MRATRLLGPIVLVGGLVATRPAAAQRVTVGMTFGDGPVWGRVYVGPRDGYRWYHRDLDRRPVVVDAYDDYPRDVEVERLRVPRGRAWGWWRQHGYGQANLWVDDGGRYYDRDDDRAGHLREVTVYQRDGRYYQADDEDRDRGGRYHRDD